MFKNIGKKIKILAKIITWIGIAISCLLGIIMMFAIEYGFVAGILIIIIGSISSWISSFLLYGFGQLIENSDKTVELLSKE